MKENLLKTIMKIVVLISLFVASAFSEDISIKCPPAQKDGRKLWQCPKLIDKKNTYTAQLKSIDYSSGKYSCKYFYAVGKQAAQVCNYTSNPYRKHKEKVLNTLNGSVKNGVVTSGLLNFESKRTSGAPAKIEFAKVFSHTADAIKSVPIHNLEGRFNELNGELFTTWKKSGKSIVHNALKKIKDLTHSHLVEPYVNPDSTIKREGTFSNFVAGLIVLDPEIVEGYDSSTGMLKISDKQKNLAMTIGKEGKDLALNEKEFDAGVSEFFGRVGDAVTNVFSDKPTKPRKTAEQLEKEESASALREISSWVSIFKDKLWGYYYNLHRRLDVGFDIISTKLLFLMAVIFMLVLGTKSGIGHLINKDHGHSHAEKNWMKALALMLGIGIFFISLPTAIISDDDNGEYEMRKNRTIIKSVIRLSVDQGANFATMMSDLGTDAFLNHIVKKQKLTSVKNQRDSLGGELSALYVYYPALETVMECGEYYETGTKGFSTLDASVANNRNTEWFKANPLSKYSGFGIDSISLAACIEAYKIVQRKPRELLFSIEEAKASMKDADDVIAVGTEHLVKNHIAITDRMGWVSAFITPVSYLVLKHSDIYLSKGIDYEKITDTVEKDIENLGITGEILHKEVDSNVKLGVNAVSDNLQYGAASVGAYIGNTLLWNLLPGFTSMREGMESYLQNIYRAKLDIHNTEKAEGVGIVGSFKDIANGIKSGGPIGLVLKKVIAKLTSLDNVVFWQTAIMVLSFAAAWAAWNLMFTTFFITAISLLLLLKTVLYFKDLIVHFFVSPFVALWAFAQAGGEGEKRIWSFLRDTLILAIYPTLIVIGGFIFIVIYELMNLLFAYLFNLMLGLQQANIGLMSEANSGTASFSAYYNIQSMRQLGIILKDIIGLFIAIVTIMKFPEYVLRKLGANEQETMMISNMTNEIHSKTERISNPMAR